MPGLSHPLPSGGTRTDISKIDAEAVVEIADGASVAQIIRAIVMAAGSHRGVFTVATSRATRGGVVLVFRRVPPES